MINFEAREFIRSLDKLSGSFSLQDWIPLNAPTNGKFRVLMNEKSTKLDAMEIFGDKKADHRIINAALSVQETNPGRKIVLASTPHEVKTIITRAGEGTKIIFTRDIFQIDTPYLDFHSNGLSTLIDKIKDQAVYAHVTIEKGERSELANLAGTFL